MSIYDKPVRLLMRDMTDAFALGPEDSFTKKQALDWFEQEYPKIKAGTIVCHLVRFSTNAPSRVHYSAKPGEDDLLFQIDTNRYRLYDAKNDPAPIWTKGASSSGDIGDDDEYPVNEDSTKFAYEADLRDYLARNLNIIEPGLSLYEEEDIKGIEFPVGGRFIDILALDSDNNFVVIELKVSRGYDRVVGQLMRYMAWIKENQAEEGQAVRGMIVAREISQDLRLACSLLDNVKLYEYELSLTVADVGAVRVNNFGTR